MDNKTKEMQESRRQATFEHWHMVTLFLIAYDIVVSAGSYFAALWLRYDCRFTEIPQNFLSAWMKFTPV